MKKLKKLELNQKGSTIQSLTSNEADAVKGGYHTASDLFALLNHLDEDLNGNYSTYFGFGGSQVNGRSVYGSGENGFGLSGSSLISEHIEGSSWYAPGSAGSGSSLELFTYVGDYMEERFSDVTLIDTSGTAGDFVNQWYNSSKMIGFVVEGFNGSLGDYETTPVEIVQIDSNGNCTYYDPSSNTYGSSAYNGFMRVYGVDAL